jgi:hypothetical protein
VLRFNNDMADFSDNRDLFGELVKEVCCHVLELHICTQFLVIVEQSSEWSLI